MVISDVDGVLTDGSIYKGKDGLELKKFNVSDGAGVAFLRAAGLELALISGRESESYPLLQPDPHGGRSNRCDAP